MNNSLQKRAEYLLKRLEQLENLPDDNPIKQKLKSGKINETLAIYYLELNDYLSK